jgi:two-component system sensor histidine kinase YesM
VHGKPREEGGLEFLVEDDGVGMPQTLVDDLNQRRSGSGYALGNVISRIRIFYGETAVIEFTSRSGYGTRIKVCIPELPKETIDEYDTQ